MPSHLDPTIELLELPMAPDIPLPTRKPDVGLTKSRSNEMSPVADIHIEAPVDADVTQSSLPPVDTGFGAWSFLLAAFLVEAIVWCFPFSFGIFLEAYNRDLTYTSQNNSVFLLPLIGPLGTGIIYCSGPVINVLMDKYPQFRQPLMWIGALQLLVILQGVVYGLGAVLLYYPCLSFMTEWFVERRGFANGAIFAGSALGGVVLPLALPSLISSQGPQKALRYLSIIIIGLLVPVLPFAKGRIPGLRSRVAGSEPRGMTRVWLKSKAFWILICVNTLQGFGHYVPIVWLPTFASALAITPAKASIIVAMLNTASFVGGLLLGWLSDMTSPWPLAIFNLVFTSLTTFILWGVLSTKFSGLLAFGFFYGLLAGGWSSLWSAFVGPMANEEPRVVTIILGYLLLSRGIGNILSTPISSALSANSTVIFDSNDVSGFGVEDGKYGRMIVYVGACFAGAGLVSVVGWAANRKSRSIDAGSVEK
ncbi:MFS general substrate transporter [Marasmius fiardii PR-910]|nr:MFS general substrate transporter [Marasmius fiardii PR-910]